MLKEDVPETKGRITCSEIEFISQKLYFGDLDHPKSCRFLIAKTEASTEALLFVRALLQLTKVYVLKT